MWPEEITEVMSERAARRGHVSIVAFLDKYHALTCTFCREYDDYEEEEARAICDLTDSIELLQWLHQHEYPHTDRFFHDAIENHNMVLLGWGLQHFGCPGLWMLAESAGDAGRVETVQLLRNHIDNLQDDDEERDLLAEFDNAVMECAGASGSLELVTFMHEQCGISFPEGLVGDDLWPEETLQWAIEHGAQ